MHAQTNGMNNSSFCDATTGQHPLHACLCKPDQKTRNAELLLDACAMKAYVSHMKQIELTALAKHHHQIGYRRSSEIN
jgi:hypothetical protein